MKIPAPMPNLNCFQLEECYVSMLARQEQLLLFSLVLALEPRRVLEIGFAAGGSARIMLAALNQIPQADQRLVSIDPTPETVPSWTSDPRFQLVRQPSPEGIGEAVALLRGKIEFCFIDGNHHEENVYADSCGVADNISDEGYVLYHDGFYPSVGRGIDRFLAERGDYLDCGLISRFRARKDPGPWGGFRLLRRCAH